MRILSSTFIDDIQSTNATDIIVILATITHPTLDGPITVNSDVANYSYNGYTYYGTGIGISLISDDESPPQAKVTVPNVDRRIGEALLSISDAPQIRLELVKRSDFDSSNPRVALDGLTVEYTAPLMFLRNVQWNAQQLTADLLSYDLTSEPWPKIRTTPIVTPALFR
jgi:uncharacterized protein DUF1833